MKCEVCSKEHNNKRFCSNKCKQVVLQPRAMLAKAEMAFVLVCEFCKQESKPGNKKRKYCSRKCFEEGRKQYTECAYCMKLFHNNTKATYCSRKCTAKGRPRKTGYKISPEARLRRAALSKRGAEHWAWRGGLTPLSKEGRRTIEARLWREAIFTRDDYTCQMCGIRGGTLNADHIKPYAKYPDLRYELSNGRTLCVDCHKKTPTWGKNLQWQE